MNKPAVTVIIAVKNGQDTMAKCLDSILACKYDDFEVIVVNDASTDKTAAILAGYGQRCKIITHETCTGPAKARNEAVAGASGELVAFTDADCLVNKNWLKELLTVFADPKVAAAGGSQGIPADESFFGRNVSLFMKTIGFATDYIHGRRSADINVAHNPSCNVMYKKDVFLGAGGFPEDLWPGEDVDLDHRLKRKGFVLGYNPKAVVYHYRPESLEKFDRMMLRYGRSQAILVRKYGFFRPVQFVFPAVMLAAVLFLALFFYFPLFSVIIESGLMLLLAAYFFFATRSLKLSLTCIVLFFHLQWYWNKGFLQGLFTNTRNRA